MSSMPPPMPGPPPMQGARGSNLGCGLAAGCVGAIAVVGVIVVVGGVIAVFVLVHAFQTGAFNCTPKDFPIYPGSSVSSISTNSTPAGTTCTEVFSSSDPPARVEPYFAQALAQGGWQASGSGARLGFQKADGSDPGTVQISASGSGSSIRVHLRT